MPRVTVAIDQPKSWNSGQFLAAEAEHPASLCTILSRGDTANYDDPQPLCKEGTMNSREFWTEVKRSGVLGDEVLGQTADWDRRGTAHYITRSNGDRLRYPQPPKNPTKLWKKRGLLDANDSADQRDLQERVGDPYVVAVRSALCVPASACPVPCAARQAKLWLWLGRL